MGLATLLGAAKGPTIGGIQVDVSVREIHTQTAEVSEHPVETGSDVADHKRTHPAQLSMEGVLSNLPTNLADRITLDKTAQVRYRELIDLFELSETFQIVTGLRVYDNMIATRFGVERNQDTGEIVRFVADFRELVFADAEEVEPLIPNTNDAPKVKKESDLGPKATKPAPPAAAGASKSVAKKLLGKVGGAEGVTNRIRSLFGG